MNNEQFTQMIKRTGRFVSMGICVEASFKVGKRMSETSQVEDVWFVMK